jgi:hypothetical protein
MTSWTPHEIEELSELVAEKVAAKLPPHVCEFEPGARMAILFSTRFMRVARADRAS